MPFLSTLVIAFALAIDAFAVSVASGVCFPDRGARRTLRLAWHFGLFQSLMTLLGWLGGLTVRGAIERFDHWVAFALLAIVAAKMLVEAARRPAGKGYQTDPTQGVSLWILSVATSLDALAVGIGFALLAVRIVVPAVVIGLVAFGMTAIGIQLGCRVSSGARLGRYAQVLGGVVLLVIGVKILFDHGALGWLRG